MHTKSKMKRKSNPRVFVIYIIFIFLFVIISFKIVSLQVFKRNFFQNLAQNQHYRLVPLEGKRGYIFDAQGRTLAAGINSYSVFADPKLINDFLKTAKEISQVLNVDFKDLVLKLKKKKRFVWIARKVSLADKEKIKALDLEGIGFIREPKRFYPQEELAAQVLGIVNVDNKGIEALEFYYNDYLSGKDGWVRVLKDSASRQIMLSSQVVNPQEGADLILTLDAQIQYWLQSSLEKVVKDYDAKGASAVVINASTGQVLALGNYPVFNPNDFSTISAENIKNSAIADIFEPGSVFKVVTLITAIEENKFKNDDTFFCENGRWKIPGTVLNDWRSYGELTFKEVFMKSSNIGVAKIVQALGPATLFRYIKKLQFGKETGIDLPGETQGLLKPLNRWSKTSGYIIPIGQEIGVNLLQLARTFGVVANGGYLVRPHLVKEICSRGFCRTTSVEKKRIISEATSQRAQDILVSVVSEGTGKRADIKGRRVGGKTGTAQKYDPGIGRYSPSKYRATFAGFIADLRQPIVIAVSVDEPRKSHFGGVVAAPVFRSIGEKIIKYIEGNEI